MTGTTLTTITNQSNLSVFRLAKLPGEQSPQGLNTRLFITRQLELTKISIVFLKSTISAIAIKLGKFLEFLKKIAPLAT
jgi:hypothetical protein